MKSKHNLLKLLDELNALLTRIHHHKHSKNQTRQTDGHPR